jgi:hypothetical protein
MSDYASNQELAPLLGPIVLRSDSAAISLVCALAAYSLSAGQEKRTMREPEV